MSIPSTKNALSNMMVELRKLQAERANLKAWLAASTRPDDQGRVDMCQDLIVSLNERIHYLYEIIPD